MLDNKERKSNIHFKWTNLEEWLLINPPSCYAPTDALAILSKYILCGERYLTALPKKSGRTQKEQLTADKINESCRHFRIYFMEIHATWLYDKLTNNKSIHKRLNELLLSAAALCPELVPTREQMSQERELIQREKEGREIDQGIFFWGLLRIPEIGSHIFRAMLKPTVRAQELFPKFYQKNTLNLGNIQIEKRDTVAYLTIQNEQHLNSEDNALIENMEVAVDLVLLHEKIHVAVLRGGIMSHPKYNGHRVFSAGINLKHLHEGKISFVEFLLQRELGYINKIAYGLLHNTCNGSWDSRMLSKPWIGAVDSFAIGGGAQLLLVLDKIIASSNSYFSLPAAREGIIPGVANLRLPRLTGRRIARQIILEGRKIFANEPDAKLIFDEVVDPLEMDAAITASISRLDSPAVMANIKMLNLAEESIDTFCSYMAEFSLEQSKRLYSKDVLDKIKPAN